MQHGEICGAKAFLLALIKIPEKVPAVKVQILAVMGKFYRFFYFLRCKIRKMQKNREDYEQAKTILAGEKIIFPYMYDVGRLVRFECLRKEILWKKGNVRSMERR